MKATEKQLALIGAFADSCTEFIKHKRALGYKYKTEAQIMLQFDKFSLDYDTSILTKKIVTSLKKLSLYA